MCGILNQPKSQYAFCIKLIQHSYVGNKALDQNTQLLGQTTLAQKLNLF